ncbi:hypothetical protein BAUCODRAFT_125942 [Baudoinia panamericana UAMH 10762]|uniref:Uncharacterized protein n=1 Tax=Baudoinia panamericana (strain UAMH 10762) TaxID=717646 RepID=M2N2X4_BAUPA|nr:uncharacterized protein BAUCODRAFT_125942 [Baudoinia panamericana UAMH 10762]EMC93005.1 hypothetical protein BAUCODRAFT_125942 [Baudoinia panamericana UAMH 10762]
MAERALIRLAQDVEDAASGLHTLRDSLPRSAPYVTSVISELFANSRILLDLDRAQHDPQLEPSVYRVRDDVGRLYSSLGSTVQDVFDMFGRSRIRPRETAWDDLQHHMATEEGLGLLERLQCYRAFLQAQYDIVNYGYQPRGLLGLRRQLMTLLDAQEANTIRPTRPILTIPGPDTPRPRPRRLSARRTDTPISPTDIYSDWDSDYARPVAPEPPPLSPLSPTFTSSSSQTLESSQTSYSEEPDRVTELVHWAQHILDGQHDRTPFRADYVTDDRSVCHGTSDESALHHLGQDGFMRVLQLPFDREHLWIRLYWRPPDGRARILIMTLDSLGRVEYYSAPLTNLKIIRKDSSLQLCKARTHGRYHLWAQLNFLLYERMVLLYCTFVAMKHQDQRGIPHDNLLDCHELKGEHERFEMEEFGGVIMHRRMPHALRLLRDRLSGVVRLEACAYHGPRSDVPLWTAFVTKYARQGDAAWAEYCSDGVVSLAAIKPPPYVFLPGHEIPCSRDGEYLLHFCSAEDGKEFVESWTRLCGLSPYR